MGDRGLPQSVLDGRDALPYRRLRSPERVLDRPDVEGTQTLLDAAVAADLDRVLQISTDEVYGRILEGTFSGDDRLPIE